jgi:aminoglycoside 3-N-acetyltransferase
MHVPHGAELRRLRKQQLKRLLVRARNTSASRFFPFDSAALAKTIAQVGVAPGDVVFAHVAYDQFAGFTGGPGDVIRVLQEAVGTGGTLLMPTLPFRGTVLDYVARGQVTDLRRTPSAMGLVTEIFRRMPGVTRSIHPTHPVALWGAQAAALAQDHHRAETPCGKSSPFLRLLDCDGKILFLGANFDTMTFYHGVEEILAPSMPFSPFTAESFELRTRDAGGTMWTTRTRLFERAVSLRRNIHKLQPVLQKRGQWHKGRAGQLRVILVRAPEVLEACLHLARAGEYCYDGRSFWQRFTL